jgi:hypothetical protein
MERRKPQALHCHGPRVCSNGKKKIEKMRSSTLCHHGPGVCSNGKKKTTMMKSFGKKNGKQKTTVKVCNEKKT